VKPVNLDSLRVVAKRNREWEAPLKANGDPSGLGFGAAALVVENAVAEIELLRNLVRAYVADENRFNRGEGEAYGSITPETGILARAVTNSN